MGMNFTEHIQGLFSESHKISLKEMKDFYSDSCCSHGARVQYFSDVLTPLLFLGVRFWKHR